MKEENANCDVNWVDKLTIRIGDGTQANGDADYAYFDDIRLYAFRCRARVLPTAADYDVDCEVSGVDVGRFGDMWLQTDYNIPDTCAPDANFLKIWYKMDYTEDHYGDGPILNNIPNLDDAMLQPMEVGQIQEANGWMHYFYGTPSIDGGPGFGVGPEDGNAHWVNDVNRGPVLWSLRKAWPSDHHVPGPVFTNCVNVNTNASELFFDFQDKTISVWVKMLTPSVVDPSEDYISNNRHIFSTTYTFEVALKTEEDNFCATFGPQYNVGSDEPNAFGHTAIKRDVWTHLALTAENDMSGPIEDPCRCTVRFYVNGRCMAVEPGRERQVGPFYNQDYHPHIACQGGYQYNGDYAALAPEAYLSDFRLYHYALSQAEIAYLATDSDGDYVGEPSLYVPLDIGQNLQGKVGDQGVYNPANIDIIDFNDFSNVARMWLHKQYWPPAGKYELPAWWPIPYP
jgi:hypothetical protein